MTSIQYPTSQRVSERQYHEAGVRGRFESNLRVVRGRIDTTTPTILQGVGFSVVRNSPGRVTITFDPPFSDVLSVVGMIDTAVGGFGRIMEGIGAPTDTAATLERITNADATEDGTFSFVAMGPA